MINANYILGREQLNHFAFPKNRDRESSHQMEHSPNGNQSKDIPKINVISGQSIHSSKKLIPLKHNNEEYFKDLHNRLSKNTHAKLKIQK